MDTKNGKSAILGIIALIVLCVGSFVGMNAILGKDDVPPPAKTTLPPTTQATQAADVDASATTDPTVSTGDLPAIIVTDPSSATDPSEVTDPSGTENSTTPSGEGVTEPSTEGTTQPKPSTQPSTKPSTSQTQPTTGSAGSNTGENGAIFDDGLGGYQYDPDGNFYYTSTDPWQRYGGYNELYDLGAPFVGIFMDTMRLKFEYDDKDWLIQFWKGQYGYLFVGHEIGVYTKPKDREVEHYDALTENDENALYMSMTGYRNGEEIYTREYGRYWWCTGFVPGRLEKMTDRSELSLSCRINAKDYAMLLAICGALKENGYVLGENFTTNGLDVYITW